MSNNIDIREGRDKDGLDFALTGSENTSNAVGGDMPAASSEDRQKKAQMMARRIAMNIGGDDDTDEEQYDDHDQAPQPRQYREEATRERTVPSRPVRNGSAQRSSSQRSSSRPQSGRRSPSQQRASQQRASSQRRNGGGNYSSSRQPQRKRRKKRSSGAGTAIGFLIGFIVVLIGVGYFVGLILTNGAFLPNTTINGIDVSKMTLAEATEVMKKESETQDLILYKLDGTPIIVPASDFGYGDDIEQQVQKLYGDINRKAWFKSLFGSINYTVTPNISYDESKLERALDMIVWGGSDPQNAYITKTADGFIIVDATVGDKPDYSILKPFLIQKVKEGNMSINIAECDCFHEAEIQASDLQDKLEYYKKFGDINITIDFDYTQEKLTLDDYSNWIQFSADGSSYTVDRDEVAQFVGHLADTYDTYGSTRKFHATIQGDIYVPQGRQGTYGWMIDQEKTTDKIINLLENGTSETIDPVYATRLDRNGNAFFTYKALEKARTAEDDIGDTYLEVDLTNQILWYYEKGEIKFETDQIVSGLVTDPSRITPEGVYEVLDKQSPYKMSGDGYTNVPCTYWIRVSYEGVGLHDLSRGSYGGQIYMTNGSHGCINMKKKEVEQLYKMIAGGTPVIMYY